jgi:nicotinamidase-related amidase
MSNNFVFFCVDTQQDFFSGGSVNIPNNESVIPNLQAITDAAEKNNIKTISTIRWFSDDSKFFSEMADYRETFPKHCVIDTKGARFIDETAPARYFLMNWANPSGLVFPEIHKNRNIVVTKKVMDIFEGNSYFEALTHNLGIPFMARPHFVVYGVDIGSTVLGLLRRGYTVSVVSDANINSTGQPFSKEDIIANQPTHDDITPKEVLELNYITSLELIGTENTQNR